MSKFWPLGLAALFTLTTPAAELIFFKADEILFLKTSVEAFNATVNYGNYSLRASKIVYLPDKRTITAEGGLFITDNSTLFLRAKRGVYYLKSGRIELYFPEGKVKEGFFNADFVSIENGTYTFRRVCASKCGDYQAEVCAKKFVFSEDEKKGTAHSAMVKVEKIPILYTPYYAFMTKRKSGFLAPTVGVDVYDNFIYQQPFFWVIDDRSDMTFTADYRSGGLYGLGIQFRKYFAYDTYLQTDNYYYYDETFPGKWWEGRNYRRKNRYLLSGEGFKGRLSYGWEYPSDKDFYYDVFFDREKLHYKSFAKSYIDYLLEKDHITLDVRSVYFYNLLSEERKADLALLPDLYLYVKSVPLGKGGAFDTSIEFTNFYTVESSFWRFRIEPRILWRRIFGTTPLTVELKPFYTYYSSERFGNDRHVFGTKLRTSLLLYNFDLAKTEKFSWFTAWETEYRLQPFKEGRTPSFDYFDEIVQENIVLIRGLNRLYWLGERFGEIIVEQPYNFYGGYNLPTDGHYIPSQLMPLKVYYTMSYGNFPLSADGKIYYDHNLGEIFYQSVNLKWNVIRRELLRLTLEGGYVLSKNHRKEVQTEQFSFGGRLSYRRFHLTAKGYYDKLIEKTVDLRAKLEYRKDCWGVALDYGREFNRDSGKYDWKVFLTFNVFARPLNIFLAGGRQ